MDSAAAVIVTGAAREPSSPCPLPGSLEFSPEATGATVTPLLLPVHSSHLVGVEGWALGMNLPCRWGDGTHREDTQRAWPFTRMSSAQVPFSPGTPEAGLALALGGAVLPTLEPHLGKSPSSPSSLPSCTWIYSLLKPSLQLSGCGLPNLRPLSPHRSSPRGVRDQPLGGHPQTQGCTRGREHRVVGLGRRRPEEIGL